MKVYLLVRDIESDDGGYMGSETVGVFRTEEAAKRTRLEVKKARPYDEYSVQDWDVTK